MAKRLKLFNGRDWDCNGGHLYVAAYSQQDAIDLVNQAYRDLKGYKDRPDIKAVTPGEVKTYWSKGCWGNAMDGVAVERGVWWTPQQWGPRAAPIRRLL